MRLILEILWYFCSIHINFNSIYGLICPFPHFVSFSELSKDWLLIEYHIHIWQMHVSNMNVILNNQTYFYKIKNYPNREIAKQNFSKHHPRSTFCGSPGLEDTKTFPNKCAHFCSEWCIMGYGIVALWDLQDKFHHGFLWGLLLTLYLELFSSGVPSLSHTSSGGGSPSNEALNLAVWPSSTNCRRGLMMKDGFVGRRPLAEIKKRNWVKDLLLYIFYFVLIVA